MIVARKFNSSTAVRARIDAVEFQIIERRARVAAIAAGITQTISSAMTSPMMLLAAGCFGVALGRRRHARTWSLLTVLNALSAWSGLVMLLTRKSRPSSVSRDAHQVT